MGRYLERQLALDLANRVLKLYSLKILKVKSTWYVVRAETEHLRDRNTARYPIMHKHVVVIAPEEPRRTLVDRLVHVLKHIDNYHMHLDYHDRAMQTLEQTKHLSK